MEQNRPMLAIPVGYVFRPEPEELLGFLVESIKLQEQWVRPPEIRNLDLYDKKSNPWTLFDGSSDQPCYVMTRLEKVAPGKSNIKRRVGAGTWKLQKSTEVAFRCQDGVKMKGLKRYLSFVPEKGCGYSREEHGQWIMNEYSLLQHGFEDYVICEIHKKSSKRKLLVDHSSDDTHNQVAMKKMRCTPCATSAHDDGDQYLEELANLLVKPTTPGHLADGMEGVTRSSDVCDDEDQELIDLIESNVEEEVACDSLVQNVDSDQDRQGMTWIQSVDPFECRDHQYSSSSSGDRDSVAKTSSCIPAEQPCCPPLPDFPDGFWDGLEFSFSGLDEDPPSVGFDTTEGFWDWLPPSIG